MDAPRAVDARPYLRSLVAAAGIDPDEAYTLAEAAALTGVDAGRIARGAKCGRLRSVKVGGCRLTRPAWLRAWIEVWYPEHTGCV